MRANMRTNMRWTYKLFASVSVLALSACGGTQLVPLGPPTAAEIAAEMTSLRTLNLTTADVQEFYKTGIYLVEDNCGGYYSDAVMASIKSAQTAGEASLLTGLAAGALGLASVSGPGVAGAGIGGAFISNFLLNSQTNSLAGVDPAASYIGSVAEMAALQNATTAPITAADAVAAIHNLARVCSPAGIKAMQEQALHSIPSNVAVVGGASAATVMNSRARKHGTPVSMVPVNVAPPYVIVR